MEKFTAVNPEIGPAAENISLQFNVPTAAAKLLDHTVIWPRAIAAGVSRHQWEHSRSRSSYRKTIITERRTLLPFLLEYWAELAQNARG